MTYIKIDKMYFINFKYFQYIIPQTKFLKLSSEMQEQISFMIFIKICPQESSYSYII